MAQLQQQLVSRVNGSDFHGKSLAMEACHRHFRYHVGYCFFPCNAKLGLINPSRLINHHCPNFFGNLKKVGPPRLINSLAYPRLINHQCWNLIFLSNNFYVQFFLSHQSQNSSLLCWRFKLIIENFKKQPFPKWSISNKFLYKNHQFG